MQHSETFAQIAGALAIAQGQFPPIPRDRTVTVQPKQKKRADDTWYSPAPYSFKYAPLETILEKIRPALAANGLALLQSVVVINDKGHEAVRTLLVHSSGEWFANETPLFVAGSDNASQAYSSGMTYARRYGVTALVCVAADEDDDAGSNEGGQREEGERSTARPDARQGKGKGAVSQPQAKAKPEPAAEGEAPVAELSVGQKRLLDAKAKVAGLDDDQLAEKFGKVTSANINDVLRQLGELAG